jgi:glycosyltransferase involved in cell wall biosynthesis
VERLKIFKKGLKIFISHQVPQNLNFKPDRVSKFFVYSQSLKDDLIEQGINESQIENTGISVNQKKYNLNAVSAERFSSLVASWNVDESRPIFLVVMEEFSSFYENLYKSIKVLKDEKKEFNVFILVKDKSFEDYKKEQMEKLEELGIDDITGFVYNNSDMDVAFKISNCYIEDKRLVYYSFYAMVAKSFGKPIIISNKKDGVNQIVQNKSGKFFNPDDWTSLKSQMLCFLESSKADKLRIQEFDLDNLDLKNLEEIYKKIRNQY